MLPQPKFLEAADDDMQIRITDRLEDVHIVVAGGAGRHSAWIPNVGIGRIKTVSIRNASGDSAKF
jgi:hypothetical protein